LTFFKAYGLYTVRVATDEGAFDDIVVDTGQPFPFVDFRAFQRMKGFSYRIVPQRSEHFLTYRGMHRDSRQGKLNSSLIAATLADDQADVVALLKSGAAPNAIGSPKDARSLWLRLLTKVELRISAPQYTQTALIDSIGRNPFSQVPPNVNPVIVKALLEAGANPNVYDIDDETPLAHFAFTGNIAIVRLLLDHGAKVNTTFNGPVINGGLTALF